MNDITTRCVEAYRKHKHLKKAGEEVGLPFQTVYVHLRKAGEPVTGDKARYGSEKDRLAVLAENLFAKYVPFAIDRNKEKFQATCDFKVLGFDVDVKSSRLNKSNKLCKQPDRFAFSTKKQESTADFFVLFGIADDPKMNACFLIPGEIMRHYSTVSISINKRPTGRWWEYEIDPTELADFFRQLKDAA